MRQNLDPSEIRIAIPTDNGVLASHFGRCEHFTFLDIRNSKVVYLARVEPPAHEPGVIPQWLSRQGASLIIAAGMGMRAQQLFNQYGIKVLIGAPPIDPEEIVDQYLKGTLRTGENACDSPQHGHGMEGGGCGPGGGRGGCGKH